MAEVEAPIDTVEAADEALLHGDGETADDSPEPVQTEPTSTESTPSGPARDEKGRFTSPAPSAEPSEADAAEIPGQPAAPETPDEPWKIAAEGSDFTFEGALRKADGIFIPAAHSERHERLIRQGLTWEGSGQRYVSELSNRHTQAEQRAQAAEAKIQAAEAQSQHVLGHFENLIAQSQPLLAQGAQMQDTPIGQWLTQVALNWPILVAESKAKAIEMKAEADRKRLEDIEQRSRQEQMRPVMESTLKQWCDYHGKNNGLDPEAITDLFDKLRHQRYESVLYVRAPHDDMAAGIRKGDLAIDHSIIEDEAKRLAKWAKPRPPATPAKSATPPAPANKPKVPPTVSATRQPAPQKTARVPKNKEEADDWLLNGEPD